MNRESAQNYLNNTKVKFMFQGISAVALAVFFGLVVLIEQVLDTGLPWLVHRILSNRHIDLSDFSYATLSSVAVATATPPSSALHMRKSSCVNIADT